MLEPPRKRALLVIGLVVAAGALIGMAVSLRRGVRRRELDEESARLVPASSERRFAIVLGNNHGAEGQRPLDYAESDADKVAQVLRELGDVQEEDLFLLRESSAAQMRAVLASVKQAIQALRTHDAASRAVLIFFFSGHSDGMDLELGNDRFSFAELRRALVDTTADARLAILDTCRSGSILGVKGGRPGAAFDTRLMDEIAITGEAFLSASTGDELALESRELGGSFFTHHLVSALRGAADRDGDGEITLSEAYRYAATRTRAATRDTIYGPQSPSFDYRLVGQGDLHMTDVRRPHSAIHLPAGFDRLLIKERARVFAEVALGGASRIALPPGSYTLLASRDRKRFTADFSLRTADVKAVAERDLTEIATAPEKPALPAVRPESFRPGQVFAQPMARTSAYFCEGTAGQWKGCRGSGCTVCPDALVNFPLYFRNHPNCMPSQLCEGKYFECSANCPAPAVTDGTALPADGWRACASSFGVCAERVADYPRYFLNHPSCIPVPGRCDGKYAACTSHCPPPQPSDR